MTDEGIDRPVAVGAPVVDVELWRQFVLAIPDGVSVVDLRGVHVEVNDAMCRLTGFARGELVGVGPPFPYWPPEELPRINQAFERTVQGESSAFELTFCRKDGSRFPVRVYPRPIEDAAGRPQYFVATVTDISEQKQSERELLTSRERWRSIAETPFDFVVEIDRDYRYVFVNHTAPGLELTDLIGKKSPLDFVDLDQQEVMRAAFERAFAEGRPQTYEVYVPALNVWFSNIVGPIFNDGVVVSLSILSRDISATKRLELQRQESEHRLRLALSGGDVGAFDVDLESGATYLSPELYALLGYPDGDPAVARTLEGLVSRIHPDDDPVAVERLRAQISDTGNIDHEARLRTATDGYRWFHGRARTFEHDGVRRLSGFVTDITARKRAEDEHAQLEQRLRHSQRLETIGTLASGIAHDFNNLLVPVLANSDDLLGNVTTPSALRGQLEDIRQATLRARELIARVLLFGRPSDERGEPVRVGPAVLEATQLLMRAVHPNVQLRTQVDDHDATILGNQGQLIQALTNLGVNANHAIGVGPGNIWIRVERVTLDEAEIARHGLVGAAVRLTVRDDGGGMSPETLERVFDPFFTTKAIGEGSGLGLSTVHAIVRHCGGVIRVESSLGKGTLFEMHFPALPSETLPEMTSPRASTARVKQHILLVDDVEMVRKVMARVLISGGHTVVSVDSAAAALAQMRDAAETFDLVITDHSMPRMSGIELAAVLETQAPGLPVILCTGLGDSVVPEPRPPNLFAVVAKPVTRAELLAAVDAASAARALNSRASEW